MKKNSCHLVMIKLKYTKKKTISRNEAIERHKLFPVLLTLFKSLFDFVSDEELMRERAIK
jgi:hypothetical protein